MNVWCRRWRRRRCGLVVFHLTMSLAQVLLLFVVDLEHALEADEGNTALFIFA